jgi:hypothetical protein
MIFQIQHLLKKGYTIEKMSIIDNRVNQSPWVVAKNMVSLTLKLNWKRYSDSGAWNLNLPPPSVGPCNQWRNVVSDDGEVSNFFMEWNRFKIDFNQLKLFVERINNYVIQ